MFLFTISLMFFLCEPIEYNRFHDVHIAPDAARALTVSTIPIPRKVGSMEATVSDLKNQEVSSVNAPIETCLKTKKEPEQLIVGPVPKPHLVSLSLEILWGCNLRCTLCNVYRLEKKHIPFGKIEEILNKIPTLRQFVVIGQGEPLLHPDWLKIMDLVKKLGLKLHIVTNGMVLNEENIMAFPPNAIVQFSIDSFRPEIYKAMRPGGDLIKILRNLQLLAQLRPDVCIGLQSIITKKTYPYIHEIATFANQFNFSFNALYPGTGTIEMFNEHYPEQQHPLKIITSPRPCQEPFISLMVGIDGDIYPCCFMYGSLNKEKPQEHHIEYVADGKKYRTCAKQYKLGNIYTDDVYKIWNDVTITRIRNSIQTSYKQTKSYSRLHNEMDFEDDQGHDYCKMCALRWGKIC
jgi:MoaA/NifB/PqqE/SkfB family radical SAM enzyme